MNNYLLIIKSKFIKCDLVKIREFIPICEMIKYLILRVCVSGDNINIEEKHYKGGGVEDLWEKIKTWASTGQFIY